ncbi:MAG TPA: hypothetical protein PLK31_25555, partial [Chloroflexota bacterium]|nr:hypothetical protein [Chloroflexota bacterium]
QTNPWPFPPRVITQSYFPVGSPDTNFNFVFSGDTSRFLDLPASPNTNNTITGGAGEPTLFIGADFVDTSELITLTISLSPHHAISVSFTLMDIDAFDDGFGNVLIDQIVVSGLNGVSGLVTPTLTATNPSNVSVTGNVATAINGLIDNDQDGGNVAVSFGSAVNQIIIVYRPGPGSNNPLGGGIALHDISFTPASPTAVSFQSLTVQSGGVTAVPFVAAGVFMLGTTAVFLRHSRRRLKTVH